MFSVPVHWCVVPQTTPKAVKGRVCVCRAANFFLINVDKHVFYVLNDDSADYANKNYVKCIRLTSSTIGGMSQNPLYHVTVTTDGDVLSPSSSVTVPLHILNRPRSFFERCLTIFADDTDSLFVSDLNVETIVNTLITKGIFTV